MQIKPLRLKGAFEITLSPHRDNRGYFMRVYDEAVFREHGLVTSWTQESQSLSNRKGVIRGLHFQIPPHAETKLVRVIAGKIFDVFVDLREGSVSYGQWDSVELSAANQKMVYLPKGFAHGFCTLSNEVVILYKMDSFYIAEFQRGIIWNDDVLKINWPVTRPFLSDRDNSFPKFKDFISPFLYK